MDYVGDDIDETIDRAKLRSNGLPGLLFGRSICQHRLCQIRLTVVLTTFDIYVLTVLSSASFVRRNIASLSVQSPAYTTRTLTLRPA